MKLNTFYRFKGSYSNYFFLPLEDVGDGLFYGLVYNINDGFVMFDERSMKYSDLEEKEPAHITKREIISQIWYIKYD